MTPGTTLKNDATGEIVYQPPQTNEEIVAYMNNLERFINDADMCDWDPLVKMCVIHHQFESIHPFSDGIGRTGRVINILGHGDRHLTLLESETSVDRRQGVFICCGFLLMRAVPLA